MLFSAIRYVIWVSILLLILSVIKFCDFNARSTQCRSCHKQHL